jgi:hypothetical protein
MECIRFEKGMLFIDKVNLEDINTIINDGVKQPIELLYSQRMIKKLLQFETNASKALQIAAIAHHICRCKIARNEYAIDRAGYLEWRETLKKNACAYYIRNFTKSWFRYSIYQSG